MPLVSAAHKHGRAACSHNRSGIRVGRLKGYLASFAGATSGGDGIAVYVQSRRLAALLRHTRPPSLICSHVSAIILAMFSRYMMSVTNKNSLTLVDLAQHMILTNVKYT